MLSKSVVERARRENSETINSSPSRKTFIISSNLGRLADFEETLSTKNFSTSALFFNSKIWRSSFCSTEETVKVVYRLY